MSTEPVPPSEPVDYPKSRRRRVVVSFGIMAGILVVYVLSLVSFHLLTTAEAPLPPVDLSKFHDEDTIVKLTVSELKTVTDRLTVNVLVYPANNLYDEKFGVLDSDIAVRLYPDNDLGDLSYAKGKAPGQVTTTLMARGDPRNWPFDTYTTDEISSQVFTGGYHDIVNARVEVTGSLDGWDITVRRVHDADDTADPNSQDNVVITFHRAKSPLIVDLGLCLILLALPVLALAVAVPMLLGRTSFLPPFSTWYAAMLFAVVPLRNFLPGSPPNGSWVDLALVLWVLIALVTAMAMFVIAWARQRDRRSPK